ncbi:hypothetical protein N9M61_02495 [Gammaproteobacteria bacterium]|nr:hypothetical protein [Gammaproteobacteria bacterium]MDA8798910.1 hypothetical protein [Gammaproteobacteria bacterium]MDC0919395.1 hypothetical protein [Gammaproteobacteria bacterium]
MHEKKILFIAQTRHQIDKAIFLKKNIKIPSEISHFNKRKNGFASLTQEFDGVEINNEKEIISKIKTHQILIFFSLNAQKNISQFVSTARQQNKLIILIQETHQQSMHREIINSTVLTADLIIAASDMEKDIFINNKFYDPSKIISLGWLFQSQYLNSQSYDEIKLVENHSVDRINKTAIVFCSAPKQITPSSDETYELRLNLLKTIREEFNNCDITFKVHPLESLDEFSSFLKKNLISNFHVVKENYSRDCLEKNFYLIVVSNKTQSFIDLVSMNIKMVMYELGKSNFISSAVEKLTTKKTDNELSYFIIDKPKETLISFSETHLKDETHAMKSFLSVIDNARAPTQDFNNILEYKLWDFVFGNNSNCLLWIEKNKHNLRQFYQLIFDIKKLNMKGLILETSNESIRFACSLILIDAICSGKIKKSEDIIIFINAWFLKDFINIFNMDSLRLVKCLNYLGLQNEISIEKKQFIVSIEKLLITKSALLAATTMVLNYIAKIDSKLVRFLIFKVYNFIYSLRFRQLDLYYSIKAILIKRLAIVRAKFI